MPCLGALYFITSDACTEPMLRPRYLYLALQLMSDPFSSSRPPDALGEKREPRCKPKDELWAQNSPRSGENQHNRVASEVQVRCKMVYSFRWFWFSIKTTCAFHPSFKILFLLFILIPVLRSPYPKGLCAFTSSQTPGYFGNTVRWLSS